MESWAGETRVAVSGAAPVAVEWRAVTALQAVPKIVRAAAGIGTVSAVIVGERLRICEQCPGGHYRNGVCGELARRTERTCGCVIALKVRLASERCPNGYWPR